jgi:hypothetical protein
MIDLRGDRAVRGRSPNAFFVLGYVEKSETWLRVSEEIRKTKAQQGTEIHDEGAPAPTRVTRPEGTAAEAESTPTSGSHIPMLIAIVAWLELIWVLASKA